MRNPLVLMYHSVGTAADDPHQLTVTPGRLAAQLAALRRRGLRGVAVRDLLAGARRAVGLTFDDGYADFATAAVPVLRQYGCTATVFALSGKLGGTNDWDADGERKRLMTAEELREVAAAGMEVASHGVRHQHLPALPEAELDRELAESREALGSVLGEPVSGFAYPYGELGPREAAAAARAGYAYACAVGLAGSGVPPGPFAVQRSYVGERDGDARLVAKHLRHAVRVVRAR